MEQNNKQPIELTTSQKNVLRQILSFISHPTDRVFILKGYAGTGKTTLMRFLIEKLKEKKKAYRLLASTGRAAKILSNLTGDNAVASTIHHMIYCFDGLNKDFDEKEEINVDKDGQLFLVFEPVKMDFNDIPETIYIIDEASMVSDVETKDITQAKFGDGRLLKQLLCYDQRNGSKFIFVGDPCQLPPIEEYYSPALITQYFSSTFHMNAQEASLTEIMRQKGADGIIGASKQIRGLYNQAPATRQHYGTQRLWGYLPFRNNSNIMLHTKLESMVSNYVKTIKEKGLNSAIFICRRNIDCSMLSDAIRTRLGFQKGCIQKGDLLMIIQNNNPTGLMNGDMVTVEEISPQSSKRAGLTFRRMKVKELFTGKMTSTLVIEDTIIQTRLNLDREQQHGLFVDFIMRMKEKNVHPKRNRKAFYDAMFDDPYLNALRCTYGYAITCHKSQGGEWEQVYMHVPRNITMNPTKETYQWIYTAMTRAQSKLHMIDDFFIR